MANTRFDKRAGAALASRPRPYRAGPATMNIVVEKQPKCVATLRVEIPAEQVSGERERIVAGYTKQAKLPGFRPGKAPARSSKSATRRKSARNSATA